MRLSCTLLLAAATGTLLTSGKAGAAGFARKLEMASPDVETKSDHDGIPVRSLRAVDETVDDIPAKVAETEDGEERARWETMDTDKLIRWIKNGKAPAKILDKMGVVPSFVTAEGQRVYSKYDEGYKFYLHYVKLVREGFFD